MGTPTAITDPRQIKKIYDMISGRNKQIRQDIFLISLSTGAHVSVVANPEDHKAAFDGRVLSFYRTKEISKGGKVKNALVRIVVPEQGHYIPDTENRVREAVERWLDPRARIVGGFPTSRKTIYQWVQHMGKKARYPRPLSPGTFRHTFCYQDLKAHKDLLRTMNKMRCSMRMIQDNYGLL